GRVFEQRFELDAGVTLEPEQKGDTLEVFAVTAAGLQQIVKCKHVGHGTVGRDGAIRVLLPSIGPERGLIEGHQRNARRLASKGSRAFDLRMSCGNGTS